MTISASDVRRLDMPWTANKIKMLVHGEAVTTIKDATGREYDEMQEGRTAYEQRLKAYETGSVDDILDVIQLDMAVGNIVDKDVKLAMVLRTTDGTGLGGADDREIADILGSPKKDRHLLDRGIELVRRHERGRSVERSGNRVGSAVCWKCMERPALPGELCETTCDGKSDKLRRQLAGLKRGVQGNSNEPYDPTIRPDPAMMNKAEIEGEIQYLRRTAGLSATEPTRGRPRNAPIAGGSEYRKQVVPYGISPDEIEGVDWQAL